jgi:hypothetical protein
MLVKLSSVLMSFVCPPRFMNRLLGPVAILRVRPNNQFARAAAPGQADIV